MDGKMPNQSQQDPHIAAAHNNPDERNLQPSNRQLPAHQPLRPQGSGFMDGRALYDPTAAAQQQTFMDYGQACLLSSGSRNLLRSMMVQGGPSSCSEPPLHQQPYNADPRTYHPPPYHHHGVFMDYDQAPVVSSAKRKSRNSRMVQARPPPFLQPYDADPWRYDHPYHQYWGVFPTEQAASWPYPAALHHGHHPAHQASIVESTWAVPHSPGIKVEQMTPEENFVQEEMTDWLTEVTPQHPTLEEMNDRLPVDTPQHPTLEEMIDALPVVTAQHPTLEEKTEGLPVDTPQHPTLETQHLTLEKKKDRLPATTTPQRPSLEKKKDRLPATTTPQRPSLGVGPKCGRGVHGVVFLPCTHRTGCYRCTRHLERCPACSAVIEGRTAPHS